MAFLCRELQRKEIRRAQLEQQHQRMTMAGRPGAPGAPLPGIFPAGAPPHMFYPGAGGPMQQQRPGAPGMMPYPMMPRGPMGPQGGRGGPRGPPMPGMPQHNMVMMNGVRGGGRGGRGGRGQGGRQGAQPAGRGAAGRGNQPAAKPAPQANPPAASGVLPGAGTEAERLTTAILANATPEQQKQMLGERLFPAVQVRKTPFPP